MIRLAKQGVFRTIQGEGHLLGLPMTFVRLAGCSVGCPQCDTNYQPHDEKDVGQLAGEIVAMTPPGGWVWITGGEPTDQDVEGLVGELGNYDCEIAVATAGVRVVDWPLNVWASVSPHDVTKWRLRQGHQLNLVPGLNGFDPWRHENEIQWAANGFAHLYATPLYGCRESLESCRRWVESHDGWKLGIQAHRVWGMP